MQYDRQADNRADNNYQSVTVDGLNTMLTECALNGANLYATRFGYCDVLEASTSMDEIMEMVFEFPMLDFTKSEA